MTTKLEVFRGVMTYNTIALYKNGTKKRFTGFIVIKDEYNNETSYKINSFRSQVIIQSEALGERGMKGISCEVHGEFKQNTWNGETKWELMAEKIFLDGYKQLAIDAEAASRPLPQVPPGILPTSNGSVDPLQSYGGAPAAPVLSTHTVNQPTVHIPVVNSSHIPAPVTGAYIYTHTSVNSSASVAPGQGPVPVAMPGAYVYTPPTVELKNDIINKPSNLPIQPSKIGITNIEQKTIIYDDIPDLPD